MKAQEIKEIAMRMEIPVKRQTKTELVREIQVQEGNTPCFQTAIKASCGQDGCLWREDCN